MLDIEYKKQWDRTQSRRWRRRRRRKKLHHSDFSINLLCILHSSTCIKNPRLGFCKRYSVWNKHFTAFILSLFMQPIGRTENNNICHIVLDNWESGIALRGLLQILLSFSISLSLFWMQKNRMTTAKGDQTKRIASSRIAISQRMECVQFASSFSSPYWSIARTEREGRRWTEHNVVHPMSITGTQPLSFSSSICSCLVQCIQLMAKNVVSMIWNRRKSTVNIQTPNKRKNWKSKEEIKHEFTHTFNVWYH